MMPTSRKGSAKSQTTGKRISARSAAGQESMNRMHQPTNRISVFTSLLFHSVAPRQPRDWRKWGKSLCSWPGLAIQFPMRTQALLGLVIAGSLALSGAAFGQTVTMTGKVLAITSSVITVQTGSDVWEITRHSTTKVTGDLKVGATVTISCNAPDAQKKEGPTGASPTPRSQ